MERAFSIIKKKKNSGQRIGYLPYRIPLTHKYPKRNFLLVYNQLRYLFFLRFFFLKLCGAGFL